MTMLQFKKKVKMSFAEAVKKAFEGCVGEEKGLSPRELFLRVYGVDVDSIGIFEKKYYWDVILKMLHKYRKEGTMFVINKGKVLFVLKTQEESDAFRKRIDGTIKALRITQDKADEWVKGKKWGKFE